MKKLSFLFSLLAMMTIAQNMETFGASPPPPPRGCTNVTVTYVGGKPYSQNHIDAYHLTRCNSKTEDYYYIFQYPEDTIVLKQNTNLQIAPANRSFGNDIHESIGTRSEIKIECTCDEHGGCGDCEIKSYR